ncbi:2OG-Fe(II) oxygenase [Brevundimonas poindexterae]|uniref:2OG-Fe(II) oxygenase n=1 Tax=Brevundimonas poindexterae TaxID=74325 RepID=UPI001CFD99A2|nr:2OG-Fe(II) oxygenase [Brevundimonas poindexterae]
MTLTQPTLAAVPAIFIKRGFLAPADHRDLLLGSLAAEGDYKPTLVSNYREGASRMGRVDETIRRSTKRSLDPRYKKLFADGVLALKNEISASIRVDFPDRSEFEIEAVNSGDGAFFSTHIDTAHGSSSCHRVISSVYYYSRSPKRFSGGQLKIYSLDRTGFRLIEADDNSIVFFPSFFPHEVLPVAVPGRAFEDGRFSVNCWINRRN